VKSESFDLEILAQQALGAYWQISLRWPEALPPPQPGEYLQCPDGSILYPMLNPHPGQLEVLSSRHAPNPNLENIAVIGKNIVPSPSQPSVILAEGIALATLIYLCAARRHAAASTLALYQLDESAPFRPRPSRFLIDGMPNGVIAAIPLLEDWDIPSRLCHNQGHAGCFEGSLNELIALAPLPPKYQKICLPHEQ